MDVTVAPGPHSPLGDDPARPIGGHAFSGLQRRPPLGRIRLFAILILMGPVALGIVTRLEDGAAVAGFALWFVALDLVSLRFGYDSRDGADWRGARTPLPRGGSQAPHETPGATGERPAP